MTRWPSVGPGPWRFRCSTRSSARRRRSPDPTTPCDRHNARRAVVRSAKPLRTSAFEPGSLAVRVEARTSEVEVAFPAAGTAVHLDVVAVLVGPGIRQRRVRAPDIAGGDVADLALIGGEAEPVAGEVAAAHVGAGVHSAGLAI